LLGYPVMYRSRLTRALSAALVVSVSLGSLSAHACACGCGIFDVGTGGLLPNGARNTVSLQYSYLDQPRNWAGSSSAPAAQNDDKHIRSEFYLAGWQHMFSRAWGLQVEVPYTARHFTTTDDDTGVVGSHDHGALGDIRIMGMYTGFSGDMSSGLVFGFKLATGDWRYKGFDRDTAIGTGTTDILLGGYHQTYFGTGSWGGFAQTQLDQAMNTRAGYRPGTELDSAFGIYPAGWTLAGGAQVTPIIQALVSLRAKDHGVNAAPGDSGYERVLVSPAVELKVHAFRLYADVERPVFQHVNGNQLVPHWQGKLLASINF